MKKLLSIILVLALALSLVSNVFAVSADTTLNFHLTCDGKDEVTKKSGDIITVTYTLKNATDNTADYLISSMGTEIYYDHTFFEYVENSAVITNGIAQEAKLIVYTNDEHRLLINGSEDPIKSYSANQVIGTFQLKIIATSGSSTIISKKNDARNDGEYTIDSTDLVVKIGNASVTPIYTLSFETNGGTRVSDIKKEKGESINLNGIVPTKNGYEFDGWYLDDELKNKAPNEITLIENTTVYAKWKEVAAAVEYTLTFETNGGSSIPSITETTVKDIDLSAKIPTKSGYTFVGWYTDTALTHKVGTTVTLDKDITLYAKWSKNSTGGGGIGVTRYKLNFETNGGSKVDSISKVRNTTVDLSKYITHKEGYSFDGWHTDKELTNKVTSIKITEETTLYAKWVEGDNGYEDNPNYKPDIFAPEHNAYIVGRDGGYIAPNENLTRAEAATIFFRLIDAQVRTEGMTKENTFVDVNENDWFNTAVSTLANLEVLKGRTADTFAPNETITRAEFMTIVARLSEAKYDGENIFSDTDGHWAEEYINIAASIKWANGDNGLFRPDDNVTRAEAMTIVNRSLNRLPENASDLLDGMETFIDNADVNAWYYLNIQEATNSHDFEMKADGVHEKWTKLNENPNWAEIEK